MDSLAQLKERLKPAPMEARVVVIKESDPEWSALADWCDPADTHDIQSLAYTPDQDAMRVSRGLLRFGTHVLTEQHRDEVRLVRDQHDRPMIHGVDRTTLDLNVSRRRGCVAMVISQGGLCGIDIETIADPTEVRAQGDALSSFNINVSSSHNDADAIWRWCGYEAVLKADGRGLRVSPEQVQPPEAVDSSVEGVWVLDEKTWHIRTIQTPPGFVGVVCCAEGLRPSQVPFAADDVCNR